MMKLLANKKLVEYYKEIGILGSISAVLGWDNNVMMPTGAASFRATQLTYLSSKIYQLLNDHQLEELILNAELEKLSDLEKVNLELIKREYYNNKAVDENLLNALTKASLLCEHSWREARKNNDFNLFSKPFKELLKLTQEMAIRKGELQNLSPYDALLNSYDYGRRSAEIDIIFADLEQFLPDFILNVQEKQKNQKIIPLTGDFSIEKQNQLSIMCMKALGFDLNRGRIDVSTHPFSTGFSPEDVRITTRYDEKNFLSGMYGVLHETGHALYEQNLPQIYPFQPVSNSCGMTIHESQSLFVENQIGNSIEFFEFLDSHIKNMFGNDSSLSPQNLYNITSRVSASLIRVEADEVTYPIHVIMRYKLEKALLSGDLEVDELPSAWNEAIYKYLKIKPTNYSDGCLQDIHWACGSIGYFPTYTLGAMLASQLNHAISKNINKEQYIRSGNFSPIISELKNKIHVNASILTPNELIINATGSKLDANIFKQYLQNKYLAN